MHRWIAPRVLLLVAAIGSGRAVRRREEITAKRRKHLRVTKRGRGMPRRVVQAITAVGTRLGRARSPRASTAPATRGANETRAAGWLAGRRRLRAIRNVWSASAVSGLMRLQLADSGYRRRPRRSQLASRTAGVV
jgi:hypothetical protein